MILNSIFELLNFRPIWIYNFWTLELLLCWTLYVQIKEEFKSSKMIYSNRSNVQDFKNIVWTLELFLHLIIWRKSSRVQKWQEVKGQELKSALHLQNNQFIQKLKLNWVFLNKCDLSLFGLKWKHIWKWKYPYLLQINAAICAPMSPRRYNELSDAQVSVEPSVSNSQLAWSAGSQRCSHFTQLWIFC